ncbi:hypothetical protein Dimus_001239, partial [Dionaea muscipula]
VFSELNGVCRVARVHFIQASRCHFSVACFVFGWSPCTCSCGAMKAPSVHLMKPSVKSKAASRLNIVNSCGVAAVHSRCSSRQQQLQPIFISQQQPTKAAILQPSIHSLKPNNSSPLRNVQCTAAQAGSR